MAHLDIILLLMALLAGLYSIAEKIGVSYQILLVVAGLGISFIPGLQAVHLTPDVVFLVFLPPLLFDAARHMSWHDLRANRGIISRLAIGLVLFSTVGVAAAAHYFVPGFDWALGFILGAIVSPPDAVAATSAIKGLRLPRQLVAILEGESLINDATALVTYRHAVAVAVMAGAFSFWKAAGHFLLVATGGIAVGIAIGAAFFFLQRRFLSNSTVETAVTLLLPTVTYIAAEHLGVSGVLAVVAAGLFVSWRAHEMFSSRTRLQMNNFWETLIFLLNGLVFILIGLQLPDVWHALGRDAARAMIGYGLFISAVVIVIRLVWIFPTARIVNWYYRIFNDGRRAITDWRYLLIIGWSGMRGVVSLATALALPLTLENGQDFPARAEILFITFTVILVTLVFQGLTLPLLIRWLDVADSEDRELNEERRLRLVLAAGARDYIQKTLTGHMDEKALKSVLSRLERHISYLKGVLKSEATTPEQDADEYGAFLDYLRGEQEIIDQQRRHLIEMHKHGAFSAEVLRRIEQDLDSRSLTLDMRRRSI